MNHSDIIQSLDSALADYKASFKSPHWDVFPPDYIQKLKNQQAFDNFRSNGLTYNLDDSLADISRLDFLEAFIDLVLTVGVDFVERYADTGYGNPKQEVIRGRPYDYNDLFLIQFLNKIALYASPDTQLICDIGGGYGGLAAKLKKMFAASTIVLLDLPEVNVLQTFYLYKNFPEARILNYQSWKALRNANQLQAWLSREQIRDYDFVILPGWSMESIASDVFDLVINTRSMMEMHSSIIKFYFDHIQRTLKKGGVFYCVNRYEKKTVGYPIRLKDYPFDGYWKVLSSSASWRQPHIHELVVARSENASMELQNLLNALPSPPDKKKSRFRMLRDKFREILHVRAQ